MGWFSVQKPLSQIQRSALSPFRHTPNRHSFGGFGPNYRYGVRVTLMASTEIQCDQCGQGFQPRRVNRNGPCYCGNACRQKAHRLRHRAISDEQRIRELEDELAQTGAKRDEFYRIMVTQGHELLELTGQVENLRRYNKGANGRAARAEEMLHLATGEEMTVEYFERLALMDDSQLRNWIAAGKAMAKKGHEDVLENSVKWAEGNRVLKAALPDGLQAEP